MSRMLSVTLMGITGTLGTTTMALVASHRKDKGLAQLAGLSFILSSITTLIMADF